MRRGALFLLPILVACDCAPATPPGTSASAADAASQAEVWIAPPQAYGGDAVAATARAAVQTMKKHDGGRYATVDKARAELIAAERDLRRHEELCRLCGGLCGHDVEDAHDRYLQAEAELERAKANASLQR